MKGTLSGLLALVSILLGAVCYWQYARSTQTLYIIGVIIFAVLLVIFGGMVLSGRFNKTEYIHITE